MTTLKQLVLIIIQNYYEFVGFGFFSLISDDLFNRGYDFSHQNLILNSKKTTRAHKQNKLTLNRNCFSRSELAFITLQINVYECVRSFSIHCSYLIRV